MGAALQCFSLLLLLPAEGMERYFTNAAFFAPLHARRTIQRTLPHLRASGADRGPGAAIITGGTGGIGLATAHQLAAQGYGLVLGYGNDAKRADAACKELQAACGAHVFSVGGDLTTEQSRDRTVARLFDVVDVEFEGRVRKLYLQFISICFSFFSFQQVAAFRFFFRHFFLLQQGRQKKG